MYPHLLSPITIRGLELPNRIVYPAMGTKMATQDKFVTEQLIHYQLARVKGGSGLNFLEVASVYEPASPAKFVSVAHDRFLPMLTRFNDVLHAAGGKTGGSRITSRSQSWPTQRWAASQRSRLIPPPSSY